jgi:thiamine biosynthesis lipoprotein
MVNIGGDVRVVGTPSVSDSWRVELEDPRTEHVFAAVELIDGGVATSTTLRRRWRLGSSTVHHLIDPATGLNGRGDAAAVVGVSVVAGTAAWADALSKVPFVDRHASTTTLGAASALIMCADGSVETHGSLRFLRAVPA